MGCSQKKCCKHLTVSLVPVTALVLALVFFCGIIALPILYEELTKYEKVRSVSFRLRLLVIRM